MLPYCTEAIKRWICRLVGISVQSEIRGDCLFIFLLLYNLFNPLVLRALPLYSFQEHRGRGGLPLLSLLRVFLRPLLIAMLLGSPLYFAAQKHPAMLRDTGEEGEMYFPFASAPILWATPRNAAGHGREEVESYWIFVWLYFRYKKGGIPDKWDTSSNDMKCCVYLR